MFYIDQCQFSAVTRRSLGGVANLRPFLRLSLHGSVLIPDEVFGLHLAHPRLEPGLNLATVAEQEGTCGLLELWALGSILAEVLIAVYSVSLMAQYTLMVWVCSYLSGSHWEGLVLLSGEKSHGPALPLPLALCPGKLSRLFR